jgi:hypothetical protein
MRFLEIDNLTCIRWHLKRLPVPDLILICAEYEYQYILHHFKGWPAPVIRINMYEPDAKSALMAEIPKLTDNSLVISTMGIYNKYWYQNLLSDASQQVLNKNLE